MNAITIMEYVNLAVLGVILVISAVHYYKFRRVVFPLIAGGAILYIGQIAFALDSSLSRSQMGSILLATVDAAAMYFWMLATIHKSKRTGVKLIVWAVIFGGVFLYAAIPVLALGKSQPGANQHLVFLIYELFLVIYCLIYIPLHKGIGGHYLFQAFIFLGIGVASAIGSLLSAGSANILPIITAAAYCIGYISVLLYVEAGAVSALEDKISTGDLRATLTDAFSTISQKLQAITDELGREEIFLRGTAAIGETLSERLNFGNMFFGRRSDTGPGFFFEDCMNRHPDGRPVRSFRSVDPVIDEVRTTRRPVIITDSCKDPRVLDLSFGKTGMNSFIAVPVAIKERLEAIVLLGGNEGIGISIMDESILEYIAGQISLFISYLNLRSEILTAPETDAVTLLRNFSSFQKLLADSIDAADKKGSTIALVLFDVDHFSIVNEKLGFERGDQLLRDIGTILSKYAEPGNIGRVGADEFAIIQPGETDQIRERIQKELPEIAVKINQVCQGTPVTLSVAYCIYPYDFFEKTGVFSKIREMLSVGRTATSQIVHVKLG
jgi:diguanylate cyclase (GGDEF)-like protein